MKSIRISARFSAVEKHLLTRVAEQLRRTQSDTLRVLIYEKAEELELYGPSERRKWPRHETRPTDVSDEGGAGESRPLGN